MALNHFSSTKATSLASGMTSNATAVYVVDGSTYPDPAVPSNGQYSIIIGYGSDREEVCTVIAKPGTNQLTVTRGQDGTAAVSKNIGDIVVHGVSARDFEGMLSTEGGTLTGPLTLSGAPTIDLHAATKKYVDDADALKAPLANPTFTGNVVVPTADANGEAVNKGQMDTADALRVAKAGDTMSGVLYAPNLIAKYDGDYGPRISITDTSNVGTTFSLIGGILHTLATGVGGLTGALARLKVATPVDIYDATTKSYVDSAVRGGSASTSTDPDGYFYVSHGLGFTPSVCLVGLVSAEAAWVNVMNWNSAGINGRLLNHDGFPIPAVWRTVAWIAVR